jgi:hypothetical protein
MTATLRWRGDARALRLKAALDMPARQPEAPDQNGKRYIQRDRRVFMGQASEDHDQQRLALLQRQSANDALNQPGRRLAGARWMAAILLAVAIGLADMPAMEMHEARE